MHHLIVNPTAGNGRAARVGAWMEERLTALGIPHRTVWSRSVGHAAELARQAVAESAKGVFAVGGDGTVSEVAQGLAYSATALGIIPAGTGNDTARMLSIPARPADALDFLRARAPRPMDAGRMNQTLFINICGMGFDVNVLEYADIAKRYVRGMLPYLAGVVRTLFTFRPMLATVSVDGEAPAVKPLMILAAANGRCFGGGIQIAPGAMPNDGLFDLVTIDAMPRGKMPFQIPKLATGAVAKIPGVSWRRCKTLTIHAPNLRVEVDGAVHAVDRAELSLLPGAILAHW